MKTIHLTNKEYIALKNSYNSNREAEFEMVLEIIFERAGLRFGPFDINLNHESKTLEVNERNN